MTLNLSCAFEQFPIQKNETPEAVKCRLGFA